MLSPAQAQLVTQFLNEIILVFKFWFQDIYLFFTYLFTNGITFTQHISNDCGGQCFFLGPYLLQSKEADL